MLHTLEFEALHSCSLDPRGIIVPVVLTAGEFSVRLTAAIDTGASFCIFRNELAFSLGLELNRGIPRRFSTATGGFEAFGHEVELPVLGLSTLSTVYFFADPAINRNVLGRVGWLDRVRLGLVEHDAALYLAPYDHE